MDQISEIEKLQVQVSLLKTLVTALCRLQDPKKADMELQLFELMTENVRIALANTPESDAFLSHFDAERTSLLEIIKLR
ncbi:hypothetical protein RGU70_12340 [Herbaspirillum sp. RTI4]|uniref:hypothetical protein n=1 Tax=Herbaspirillum sp. RTI4 TaxID=3048640 RepID=UPI002AB54E0E|nr:hypothetical protein [Herbaspirillum sp. RTI4]MDY7579110.1 hypothetical protein [Herbaspirillum sp. RTI4]MEA9981311.1 hypothetical protein [Herbaspirillum sp. RTI4]